MARTRTHNRTHRGRARAGDNIVATSSDRMGIKLKNGNRLNHGQLFPKEGTTIMQKNIQRPLNSSTPKPLTDPPNIARDGSAKRIVDAPIKPGMTRQTKGDLHPYLHGQAVDDEPNSAIIKSHEKPIGFSHGVTDKQIIKSVHGATAGQVLHDAARLGRPPEKA